ncbi:sister chromatid cohesion protein Ctf8 [Histoplasma capsulatum var. duboisii H88]|uniref:Sister chromatid cohesion protein Ctf8 n=1 Tax=Ajellomyces capsulatus (strain H88) TaxID=544711 RepID=F0UCH9_AJEC8|nr:sister chromatid cohesion protein Ctf8 [Histoplasma capsulatum var. duboisii H88]
MPTVRLHPPCERGASSEEENPLPQLLQTPSGLAMLELQGTINLPDPPTVKDSHTLDADLESSGLATSRTQYQTPIGRLIFPDYNDSTDNDPSDHSWMKRVYLYVGRHQRLTGEVKKLPRPLAAIQRVDEMDPENGAGGMKKLKQKAKVRAEEMLEDEGTEDEECDSCDELEIVDIIRYKIIFSSRPEPVSSDVDNNQSPQPS